MPAGRPGAGAGLVAGGGVGLGRPARARPAGRAPPRAPRRAVSRGLARAARCARYDHYERLDASWRARFEDDLRIFLAEKRITGVGVDVDDELRLLVAASAVTLSVGWPDYEWDQLTEVLLYPDDFDRDYRFGGDERAGEAHPWGTVILSVPALLESFEVPDDALPRRPPRVRAPRSTWTRRTSTGSRRPRRRARARVGGAWPSARWSACAAAARCSTTTARTTRSSSSAVAVEAFFEVPQLVRRRHREVYAILSAYFGQDPAAWDDARGLRE